MIRYNSYSTTWGYPYIISSAYDTLFIELEHMLCTDVDIKCAQTIKFTMFDRSQTMSISTNIRLDMMFTP